ncbi:Hypothetical predicted protein [Cloeon dipterum]|uniref:Small ribosomal subunit protein mS23 n=1 Tax=Cloeon dipterum TaxID=197152 RepID=A0A8S1CSS0_9INSE|nr:Hypothetical predicted protein [Cloeon dipterum]
MASSRLERVGTIYTRVRGLLKAGALRPEDKPIWYDIYEAFPPKNLASAESNKPLRQILYAEDEIRSRYHKEKVSTETVNLQDTLRPTKCQQFISKYQDIEKENQGKESGELYMLALESIKMQATTDMNKAEEVTSGDTSLAASFKNAFNTSDKKNRSKVRIADIIKDAD